jgi:hypothetical protein
MRALSELACQFYTQSVFQSSLYGVLKPTGRKPMYFTPKKSAFKVESPLISAEVVGDYEMIVKGLGSALFTELVSAVNHQLGAQVVLL